MIKSILLLDNNYSFNEISKILLVDDDTIRNWHKRFLERETITDWLSTNYVFYTGKLIDSQIEIVEDYLTNSIISDSKQLIEFISSTFGIIYSTAGIVSLLHRLGYKYKNTTLIPSNLDTEKQQEFKEFYEELEQNLPADEVILFGDGVHPQHNTVCAKAWIKEGKKKTIESNTGRTRVSLHGAYNPENQDIVIHEDKTLNTENTIDFLKKIEANYESKSKIHLILDNAKYYKNGEIEKFLRNSKINIIYLPTYSPNLNLIERLWKYFRKKVLNNKFYEKFALFRKKILDFFENIEEHKSEIASFIGKKLHLLT